MPKLKIKDVAAHLGVEPQSAGRLLRELNLTTADSLDRIRLSYIARLRAEAGNNGQSPERERLLTARRKLLEAELRKRMRQSIDVDEAQRILVGGAQSCRTRLDTVDRRLRANFPALPEDVLQFIRREHTEALAMVAIDVGEPEEDEKEVAR